MGAQTYNYECLIEAFDTVDRTILLDKLLARDLPAPVLRFLIGWYISQRLHVNWIGHNFKHITWSAAGWSSFADLVHSSY